MDEYSHYCRVLHKITQLVASQSHHSRDVSLVPSSSEISQVGQFMRLNPSTCMGTTVEENPLGFIDKIDKIFRIMHASVIEGIELVAYQRKDIAI